MVPEYVRELFFINFTYKTGESERLCINRLQIFFVRKHQKSSIFCTSCTHVHDLSTPELHSEVCLSYKCNYEII